MKKHILKKFLHETELPEDVIEELKSSTLLKPIKEIPISYKIPKDTVPYLTTEDNKFFKAFAFRHGKKVKLIPEPDPILVYFHAAYLNYIQIKHKKDEIFNRLDDTKIGENIIKELYDYFSVTSGFVILLFTAIEALMNRCIPTDYQYKRTLSKKTELFSKKQIEDYIPFDEKLNSVLYDVTGKSFQKQHPIKYTIITNLKEFRNMIVHTKETENQSTYDYLYKRALNFDYATALDVTKDFCNFYTKPDFIEECSCSQNW